MVEPDANGHVSAERLSAELGGSNVLGYPTAEASSNPVQNAGFYECQALKTIEIPDSVETIGSYAFYNSGLTSLTIPSSVKAIRNDACWKCDDLESVNFNLATQLTSIGDYAFQGATALTSVTLPEGLKEIGKSAFYYAEKLLSINLDDVTSIGSRAFSNTCLLSSAYSNTCYTKCRLDESTPGMNITTGHGTYLSSDSSQTFNGCYRLTSVTIGDNVETIGNYAFYGTNLTSVTIPDSVKTIGDGAFSRATALTSVTIPDSVTEIGNGAFYYATGLTSIDFRQATALEKIGYLAFNGASALTSVTLPEGLKEIGDSAFKGCTALTSMNLPDSVTTIGDAAFPPGLFILDLFKREGTPVSTMLDQFSLQELKDNYRSRSGCSN